MKEIYKTSRFSAKEKGKQPDLTRMWTKKSEERKPSERLELASVSTREKPRLLGGTLTDAHKFVDNLTSKERTSLAHYRTLQKHNGADAAKKENPDGYELQRKYNELYAESSRPTTEQLRPTQSVTETSHQTSRAETSRQTTGELRLTPKDLAKRAANKEWERAYKSSLGIE